MIRDAICNVFSVLAVVFFIGSIQFKKKKDILLVQSGASFCYCLSYFLLGAYSGAITEFIEQVKNLIFYKYEKEDKKIPLIYLIIFMIVIIIVSVFTYNGINTLVPLLINILYFISSYIKNPKYIRLVVLICGFIWLYYNFSIGGYILIIGNIFEIISGIVSLIRFRDEKI